MGAVLVVVDGVVLLQLTPWQLGIVVLGVAPGVVVLSVPFIIVLLLTVDVSAGLVVVVLGVVVVSIEPFMVPVVDGSTTVELGDVDMLPPPVLTSAANALAERNRNNTKPIGFFMTFSSVFMSILLIIIALAKYIGLFEAIDSTLLIFA